MPNGPAPIVPSESLDKRVLEYVLAVTERAQGWWEEELSGSQTTRRKEFEEYRLRMEGRRSVADLYHDAKTEPFDGASNIGVGIEQVFSEFLIPLLLANTIDLEPPLQAILRGTTKVHDDLTTFHSNYHRYDVPGKREIVEASTRELLTVGSCFHKWTYASFWRQAQIDFPVWVHPLSGQPMMKFDQGTGRNLPTPADPKTPKELIPVDPATGIPYKLGSLKAVNASLVREGPELAMIPVERMGWPEQETRPDPALWDWVKEDFDVSPYWLLGREGDPMAGKMKLKALWQRLGLDPNTLYENPQKLTQVKPIKLRAWHGKYPATASGEPVEITAMIAVDEKLMLGWRPSPFPRRNYFNRQVWHSGTSPIGRGIPETVYSLRSAMDALLNQDIDAGNLYNHPPLLLSDLAMLEDEDYETTGPGATWLMRDINGAKFLPPPVSTRDPVNLLNWLMSNTMRIWGVSDLMLNSPSNALATTPKTASGTRDILNAGSIKFGHLTKRLSATDTLEYQYVHDCFRLMLANPKLVVKNGQPFKLESANREEYFAEMIQLAAVGNGISTNPIIRQQSLGQFLQMMAGVQDPFVMQDMEVRKQLDEQIIASYGLDLTLKDPQVLQQIQVFQQLMQTPEGQALIPQAMQASIQAIQAKALLTNGTGTPQTQGAPNGSRVPVA